MIKGLLILLSLVVLARGQDTFSIVAVDTTTGEVGAAGASCVNFNLLILSYLKPGWGGVNVQSYWVQGNYNLAKKYVDRGLSPSEVLDSLVQYDVENDSAKRQYGAVDLINNGRSATFTGSSCFDWAGGVTGKTYAIQGNILKGSEIVTDMETAFLNAEGTLADRMMAAMQAAKVPGADTRCLSAGTSSSAAFIRVFRSTDSPGTPYLQLSTLPGSGVEPIDKLQQLYDNWKNFTATQPSVSGASVWADYQAGKLRLHGLLQPTQGWLHDIQGREVWRGTIQPHEAVSLPPLTKGLYLFTTEVPAGRMRLFVH